MQKIYSYDTQCVIVPCKNDTTNVLSKGQTLSHISDRQKLVRSLMCIRNLGILYNTILPIIGGCMLITNKIDSKSQNIGIILIVFAIIKNIYHIPLVYVLAKISLFLQRAMFINLYTCYIAFYCLLCTKRYGKHIPPNTIVVFYIIIGINILLIHLIIFTQAIERIIKN